MKSFNVKSWISGHFYKKVLAWNALRTIKRFSIQTMKVLKANFETFGLCKQNMIPFVQLYLKTKIFILGDSIQYKSTSFHVRYPGCINWFFYIPAEEVQSMENAKYSYNIILLFRILLFFAYCYRENMWVKSFVKTNETTRLLT